MTQPSSWNPHSRKARLLTAFVAVGVGMALYQRMNLFYQAATRHETMAQATISQTMEQELVEAALHKPGLILNGQADTVCADGTCVRMTVTRYTPRESIEAIVQYGEGTDEANTIKDAPLPENRKFPWLGPQETPKWRRFRYPDPPL